MVSTTHESRRRRRVARARGFERLWFHHRHGAVPRTEQTGDQTGDQRASEMARLRSAEAEVERLRSRLGYLAPGPGAPDDGADPG